MSVYVQVKLSTWWTILRIALEERLVYRGDFALGTLMRFLPIITQIFLWSAIFSAVNVGSGGDQKIAGFYTIHTMIAYYLLTMVSRAFSSMPGLASGVALQVRNGEIKKFLIQPVDMVGFLLMGRIAHKLAYYSVALLPFALVFYLCGGYFSHHFATPGVGAPSAQRISVFISSLLLGFMLGYFLELCIGLISFWFLEVTSLIFVYNLLTFFLSGHMFPLDLLPDSARGIVDWMPLRYLAYFPAAVLLGRVGEDQLWTELLLEAGWVLFFIVLSRWMFSRGVKRYSGYGG
jgi:ABC-2 type transport system permease protein